MGGVYDRTTMRTIDRVRRRYVLAAAVGILLGYGTLWLAGHSLTGPIEGARAILSMTSDAPFQAGPEPTAPIGGTSAATGSRREPEGSTVVAVVAGAALLAVSTGLWLARRRHHGQAGAP